MKLKKPSINLIVKLALFFVFVSFHAIAQNTKLSSAGLDRINYCFSASRPEVGENLCLFYNHTFQYSLTYGAVDQYAKGSYYIHQDTIYLNSRKAPAFVIHDVFNPAIAKGKIKIRFKKMGRNSNYVSFQFDDEHFRALEYEKKLGDNYEISANRPAQGVVILAHDLYDKEGTAYTLELSKNDFTVSINDSIGMMGFDNKAFVFEGADLRLADDEENEKLFNKAMGSAISYEEIPWAHGQPEITKAEFNEWNQKQDLFFSKLNEENEQRIAEHDKKKEKETLSHITYDWSTALRKATQDSSGIIAMFGVDSIPYRNTEDELIDSAIASLKKSAKRQYLITGYYTAFLEAESSYDKTPKPVFYNYRDSGEAIKKKFHISRFPAIVIANSKGEPFFKIEGTPTPESELLEYYKMMLKENERKWQDSTVNAFKSDRKDSLSLMNMILALEYLNKNQASAMKDAGISTRKLLDALLENYVSPNSYSLQFYDFVLHLFRKQESDVFADSEIAHTISPTLEWLINHFGYRLIDSSYQNKDVNDSILFYGYNKIQMELYYSYDYKDDDSVMFSKLLAMNRTLITGHSHLFDFFSSIGYLSNEFRLIESKKMSLNNYEKEINDFFDTYTGGFVTVSSAILLGRTLYREGSENSTFEKSFSLLGGELGYINQVRSTLSLKVTELATVKMMRYADTSFSASIIKTSDVMSLLELADKLSASPDFFLPKRNYAYALYEMGDVASAIELMQEVVKMMKASKDKYLVQDPAFAKTQKDLELMKAKKKVNFLISDLVTY